MDAHRAKFHQALAELKSNFLEIASERLDDIEALLLAPAPCSQESLLAVFRHAHNLKGSGGTFDLPSVSMIAHRLEEYLSSAGELNDNNINEIMAYIDALRVIVSSGEEPSVEILNDILRKLPAPHKSEFALDSREPVDVLLVTPSSTMGRVVARELSGCGYRVTQVNSPWEALQMAVYARPDVIITSVVMSGLTGIDLLNALNAMAPTQDIPVAILTSFSDSHSELASILSDTPTIRSGNCFRNDLADALTEFGIA